MGKLKVKKPNMMGIIHCIIRFILAWLEPAAGALVVLILCKTHIEPPTSKAMNIPAGLTPGLLDRSNPRKPLFNGTAS